MHHDAVATAIRIWTNPLAEDDNPTLIALTLERLSLAVVPAADVASAAEAVKSGQEIVATHIPLSMITSLQGDQGDASLTVAYRQGESSTEEKEIALAESLQRDELLAALSQQLGPSWTREEKPHHRLYAGLFPFLALVVVGLVTWFMHGEAQRVAAGQQGVVRDGSSKVRLVRNAMIWVEGKIGARGVLVAGGVLGGICLVWLGSALTHPPIQITVQPEG